jgi:hypothetical protein
MIETPPVVPAIKVFLADSQVAPDVLANVLAGAEEEGVPCEVEQRPARSAAALAYEAASKSVLGVGIGVDGEGVLAVHFHSLPEDEPLFVLQYRIDADKVRVTAENAARLVKGIPFELD